jgi:hypothetical protein
MRKLLLILWFATSAFLLLAALVLGYMSIMMGAIHWDWWLALGLGLTLLAMAVGCFWMCRLAYRLLKAS